MRDRERERERERDRERERARKKELTVIAPPVLLVICHPMNK